MIKHIVAGLLIRSQGRPAKCLTLDPRQIIEALSRRNSRQKGGAQKTPPMDHSPREGRSLYL